MPPFIELSGSGKSTIPVKLFSMRYISGSLHPFISREHTTLTSTLLLENYCLLAWDIRSATMDTIISKKIGENYVENGVPFIGLRLVPCSVWCSDLSADISHSRGDRFSLPGAAFGGLLQFINL
jgi:hypothetical protein